MSPISLGVFGGARHTQSVPTEELLTFVGVSAGGVASGSPVTYTHSDVPFGDEAPERMIVLAIGTRVANGSQIASVTIGGLPATIDCVTPTWPSALIARAMVPTGTSGTVTISYTGTESRPQVIGVYVSQGKIGQVHNGKHYSASNASATTTVLNNTGDSLVAVVANSRNDNLSYVWGSAVEEDAFRDRNNNGSSGFPPIVSVAHKNSVVGGPTTVNVNSTNGATYQGLAVSAYESLPSATLSLNRFDCQQPGKLSEHVSAGHTNYGKPLVSSHDGNTRVADSSQNHTLWFDSHAIYGARVLADVGQSTNLKISTRIIGRVLSGATAQDRHYGIAIGCPAPTAADGIGGLGYYLTYNGILTGGQITSGWMSQTGILTSGIPMSDDMEMSVELSGLDVVVTIDGNVVYTTTLASPTVGNYAGAHVYRVQWNAMIGYKWIKVEAL